MRRDLNSVGILRATRPWAFTLVELLVVLAILGILIAILLPAVQYAREASRRGRCAMNLRRLGVAVGEYQASHQIFPPGGSSGSLFVSMLPHLEASNLYDTYNQEAGPGDPANWTTARATFTAFICPSDSVRTAGQEEAATSYAGNFGNGVQAYCYNGMFRHLNGWGLCRQGPVRPQDVTDGLSKTAAIAEQLPGGPDDRLRRIWFLTENLPLPTEAQLERFASLCAATSTGTYVWTIRGRPWTHGDVSKTLYNHILPPNENSCYHRNGTQWGAYTSASMHPGGVNVLFGDGHALFVADSIDKAAWRSIGSRNGGEAGSSLGL